MKCQAHADPSDCYGEVKKVDVVRIGHPSQFWTFNYCQEAIKQDEKNGFKVTLNTEDDPS